MTTSLGSLVNTAFFILICQTVPKISPTCNGVECVGHVDNFANILGRVASAAIRITVTYV